MDNRDDRWDEWILDAKRDRAYEEKGVDYEVEVTLTIKKTITVRGLSEEDAMERAQQEADYMDFDEFDLYDEDYKFV